MKYRLSINKGEAYKKDERYRDISLGEINPVFLKDNNLEELCKFTMQFKNMMQLKYYLVEKGLLAPRDVHFDLNITYQLKENVFALKIPLQDHQKYFDINYLCNIISSKCVKDRSFAIGFLYLVKDMYGIELRHINDLKLYGEGYYQNYRPDPMVRAIVLDIVKRKGKVNYRSLFDLVMLVSPNINVEIEEIEEKKGEEINLSDLSETQLFKAEEWGLMSDSKDDPNQYRLF